MLTLHVADGAKVVPQVFAEMTKSLAFAPVRAMDEMVSVALPVFVRVVERAADVVPTDWSPKERDVGEKLVPACVPVPFNATFWGLAGAESVKVKLAALAPVAPGVNVTLTTQLAPTASEPPQVFAEIAKSAAFVPVSVTEESVREAVPGLETVVVSAAEVAPTV